MLLLDFLFSHINKWFWGKDFNRDTQHSTETHSTAPAALHIFVLAYVWIGPLLPKALCICPCGSCLISLYYKNIKKGTVCHVTLWNRGKPWLVPFPVSTEPPLCYSVFLLRSLYLTRADRVNLSAPKRRVLCLPLTHPENERVPWCSGHFNYPRNSCKHIDL